MITVNTLTSRWLAGIMRLLNLFMALLLSVPALITIGVIYVYRLASERGRPVEFFYRGTRLGLHLKPYTMYKIRTLKLDAEFEQQGVILPPGSGRELNFGRFLRESRLDELPQLWNVIKGDMNFVGPRPMRPVVYEQLKEQIPNCDQCFLVKPGMTGYSQFLTPSHTPRRIRVAIDCHFIQRGTRPFGELFLIFWTIAVVLRSVLKTLSGRVTRRIARFVKRDSGEEHRVLKRHRPRFARMQMTDTRFAVKNAPFTPIHDINHRAFSYIADEAPPLDKPFCFFLVGNKECETGPVKKARCSGYVYRHEPASGGSGHSRKYVIFYEPVSELHRYMADHYVLHETVA